MKLFNNKYFLILIILVVSVRTGIYYAHPWMGIPWGIFIGLTIAIPFLLIIYLLEYFLKPKKLPKYIRVVLLIPSLFLLFMLHKKQWFPPSDMVFNHVFDMDKPKSIMDLKAYAEYPGRDVILRLKFKVNKVDFDNIIKKFKLKKFDKSEINYPGASLFSKLDVFYLSYCKKLSWWDIKHLKPLPQYEWLTEHDSPRTLWIEHLDSDVSIIYVSGVGWG